MDGKNEVDRMDEVMLPGFRFHPTDEELVGFYLRRKIQQKPLSIELIKQLDIYKFDPWDLPKMATTGEREWYFYCPRDRKYRNSARPNRVTCAGFWKATGTDRPIYSSEGTKCIGLKKSLVFYKGRAAKGIKTDWMMHEFRLPSLSDSIQHKNPLDKNIPANDSWAICRIFKKNNSMAQRALFHSWASPMPETIDSDIFSNTPFSSENISSTTEVGSTVQFCSNKELQQTSANVLSYKAIDPTVTRHALPPISNGEIPPSLMFSPLDTLIPAKSTLDVAAMLLNLSPAIIGDISRGSGSIDFGQHQQSNSFSVNLQQEIHEQARNGEDGTCLSKNMENSHGNYQWGIARTIGFPFNLPENLSSNLTWNSPSCPSEMSTNYSTN